MANSMDRVLDLIVSRPGLTISEIALKLGLAKSTVSEIVTRLEKKGVVKKVRRGSLVLVYPSSVSLKGRGRRLRIGFVRAAEYPFLVRFASRLKMLGYTVELKMYGNGLDATLDLVSGRLELALTPMPTQILFHILSSRLKIIGGGVTGGARVVKVEGGRQGVAVTTRASTMELCLSLSGAAGLVNRLVYASAGSEILQAVEERRVEYAAVWEPYASMLPSYAKTIAECGELGIESCCTLAASTSIPYEERQRIAREYVEALTSFWQEKPEAEITAYADIVNLPAKTVRKSLEKYRLEMAEPDPHYAVKTLEKAGLRFPHPSWAIEAFEK